MDELELQLIEQMMTEEDARIVASGTHKVRKAVAAIGNVKFLSCEASKTRDMGIHDRLYDEAQDGKERNDGPATSPKSPKTCSENNAVETLDPSSQHRPPPPRRTPPCDAVDWRSHWKNHWKLGTRTESTIDRTQAAMVMFKKYDVNGDNVIDKRELRGCIRRLCGLTLTEMQVDGIMEEIDTNSDGVVDKNEFVRSLKYAEQRISLANNLPKNQSARRHSAGSVGGVAPARIQLPAQAACDGEADRRRRTGNLSKTNDIKMLTRETRRRHSAGSVGAGPRALLSLPRIPTAANHPQTKAIFDCENSSGNSRWQTVQPRDSFEINREISRMKASLASKSRRPSPLTTLTALYTKPPKAKPQNNNNGDDRLRNAVLRSRMLEVFLARPAHPHCM
jgi:hypothetical protein